MIEKDKSKENQRSPIPAKKRGTGLQLRGKRTRGSSSSSPHTGNIPFPNYPSGKLQAVYVPVEKGSNEMKVSWSILTQESASNFDIPSILLSWNEEVAADKLKHLNEAGDKPLAAARGRPLTRGRKVASKSLAFRKTSQTLAF